MSSKKHTDTVAELNKLYEENEIQLKGIFSFAIGLFLLIVVTFGLMWSLLGVLEDYFKADTTNPMAMSDKERLPPEPRLQGAPGFGVDSDKGRVNMELGIPQAEWRELRKQWDELLEKGRKDAKTGMVSVMPIDEAKKKLLERGVKAKSGADAEAVLSASREFISEAGSGRMGAQKRR
ncbi:MAG: hypothetical protein WBD16_03500 [Pyrinomonadaceae bacterium]